MNILYFIHWNPDIIAFSLGPIDVRWYSLFWCIGLISVYHIMHYLYKKQNISEDKFEPMFIYCFLGILIGARLGHCLFYEPSYFLSHPVEMFLPIGKGADGSWHFTGYAGLASHGGTIGLMITLLLYSRKTKLNIMRVLDNVAIVTPVCACAIRLGNLMNSEIIGKPTDVPWAFVFEKVDMQPRHPGQLYESICYALFFLIEFYIYKKSIKLQNSNNEKKSLFNIRVGSGFYFGLALLLIFLSRIFIEFTKDIQVDFESDMFLNMGQLLSIPFVLLGLYCMLGGKYCRIFSEYK